MDINGLLRIVETSSRVVDDGYAGKGAACIDMVMVKIAVDRGAASARKKDIIRALDNYPVKGRLEEGNVSYKEIANTLKISEEHSLRLMAIGKHLGLWEIETPESRLHMLRGCDIRALVEEDARSGKLMISKYKTAYPRRRMPNTTG